MTRRQKRKRNMFLAIFVLAIVVIVFYFFKVARHYPNNINLNHSDDFFGVTFSTKFCEELGLDWRETYLAVIDDLKVREIRIPIYWDEIEKEDGVYDFSDYDFIINEGEKRGVKFVAAIGWRLPRWPECHAPKWAEKKGIDEARKDVLDMLPVVVNRYKDKEAIKVWQVENEPLLDAFGVCPPSNEEFLQQEIALVKSLDNKPVLVTATGELSFWRKEAVYGDIFGSTIYRVVWGAYSGYVRYPYPAWFYRLKADMAGISAENRYIAELQAEPWVSHGSMIYYPKEEAEKSFNLEQFRANLQFAINTGFAKSYLWGVEWWYFQKIHGDSSYWDFAKTLF